ncbi:peptidoglycan-binding protein [Rhodobacteraceae bacterium]|nr:peptidoglycan-binding protein [Paracoccaceae bacterium]
MRFGIILAGLLAFCAPAFAQSIGLLIGNEDYWSMPDVRNADQIATAKPDLDRAGIETISRANATLDDTLWALQNFVQRAEQSQTLVIGLAGQFVHSAAETYFLPVDEQTGAFSTLAQRSLPMSTVFGILAEHPGQALLVLATNQSDQTNGPLLDNGIGDLKIPNGVTVLSGLPDNATQFLRRVLPRPGRPFVEAARQNNLAVFGFAPDTHVLVQSTVAPPPRNADDRSADIRAWRNARRTNTAQAYQDYLERHANGEFVAMAENRIQALNDTPAARAQRGEQALDLSRNARREIQRDLTLLDFNTRGIDGIFGNGTRTAIGNWQRDQGVDPTGFLNARQITSLNNQAERRSAELEIEAERRRQELIAADVAFWNSTGANGGEGGLRAYLDRYPDGEFADEATSRLNRMEQNRRGEASIADRRLWDQVRQVDTIPAYNEYLRRAGQGAFREEASNRIQQLQGVQENSGERRAAQQKEQSLNLSPRTRQIIEARLNGLDMKPGPVDGVFDRDTRRAIRRYQAARRLDQTGFLSEEVVVRLLADSVRQIFR